jgi:transposase
MLEALIDGERDPAVLADLARTRMRAKLPELRLALEGRFNDHHALMLRLHLDHVDHLSAMIDRLDEELTVRSPLSWSRCGGCRPSPAWASAPLRS